MVQFQFVGVPKASVQFPGRMFRFKLATCQVLLFFLMSKKSSFTARIDTRTPIIA